jgi:hypothetical protein
MNRTPPFQFHQLAETSTLRAKAGVPMPKNFHPLTASSLVAASLQWPLRPSLIWTALLPFVTINYR